MASVLIHGAWHGAWCWQPVLDRISAPAIAVDLPLTSLDDDVAVTRDAVRRFADETGGPVTLVGHSYGGLVVSHAAVGAPVSALVYVAALALDVGETILGLLDGVPQTALFDALVFSEDGQTATIDPEKGIAAFYADCDPDDARAAVSRLRPQPMGSMAAPATAAAWRNLPSTYILCERDAAVHPQLQETLAERMGARVVRMDASHSPFLSRPDEVAAVLTA